METLPRTVILLGKGGVGRSTLAAAMGHSWAKCGQRTLVVQASGDDVLASWFGTSSGGYTITELEPKLHTMVARPRDALKEFLMRQVRLRLLYRLLFANRPMQAFLDAVLGLSDLIVLGKIADLERETRTRSEDGATVLAWDRIVVDMPATGHALTMLRAPANMVELTRRGPLHANAQWILELLNDPRRCAVALATWAEELPVQEALESIQNLGESPPVALCVLSGIPKQAVDQDLQALLDPLAKGQGGCAQMARAAQADLARWAAVDGLRESLAQALDPSIVVDAPRMPESLAPPQRIEALAAIMEQA